jgi:hypothetical protein
MMNGTGLRQYTNVAGLDGYAFCGRPRKPRPLIKIAMRTPALHMLAQVADLYHSAIAW